MHHGLPPWAWLLGHLRRPRNDRGLPRPQPGRAASSLGLLMFSLLHRHPHDHRASSGRWCPRPSTSSPSIPPADFFFGLTWSPNFRGGSELGLPSRFFGARFTSPSCRCWSSVPVGLFTAIYLAEYASRKGTRNWVKPLIEVIAGIPDRGVRHLRPRHRGAAFLREWFAEPTWTWAHSGSSVMTAGIVIGILNIPFISSLSDDIINAVPQSLRDGSATGLVPPSRKPSAR